MCLKTIKVEIKISNQTWHAERRVGTKVELDQLKFLTLDRAKDGFVSQNYSTFASTFPKVSLKIFLRPYHFFCDGPTFVPAFYKGSLRREFVMEAGRYVR